MKFRNLKNYINDPSVDIQDRMFIVMSLVAIVGMFFALLAGVLLGEKLIASLLTFGFLVFAVTIVLLGYKFNKVRIVAFIVSVMVILISLPSTFFTSGGVYGGTPIWFLFVAWYVITVTRGGLRIVCLCLEAGLAAFCWFVEYYDILPVVEHNTEAVYMDSLLSLYLVMIVSAVLLGFQTRLQQREAKFIEEQKKQIEELNAAQNRFFSSMSHEIRTPINTIIGLNETILREDLDPEIREDAANIQSAGKMLLHLINDILDMSKIESGQMTINKSSYHTGDMLSDIVSMIWSQAASKGLEFHVEIAPGLPAELMGDEVRIKQILINVLNNAVKYTKQGSVILSIRAEESEDAQKKIVYIIKDTGVGIKKENLPHLFNAFKRVDEDKNKYIEGTGLGLSIVKQLVELMGGTIEVNSVYTVGSTFIITLPQEAVGETAMDVDGWKQKVRAQENRGYQAAFTAPGANVLVVDDTRANLMVVEKLLRDTKVQVDTASSGKEALALTQEHVYHVIFMDHLMPEMDGIECMKQIRSQVGGRCKESKIVALTANTGSEMQSLYQRSGFDGYLVKPISGASLESELYRLLPPKMITSHSKEIGGNQENLAWIWEDSQKQSIKITTDSVADLPRSLLDRYDIAINPMMVITSKGSFRDSIDIDMDGILDYIDRDEGEFLLRAASVEQFERFFAEQLIHSTHVIHLSTSDKVMHRSYQAAVDAAKSFDNVYVVDTGHLSSGQGLFAIEAARMASEGKEPAQIVARMEQMRSKVHTSYITENLDYLQKAKLVSSWMAQVTKSMMMHPVLHMDNGNMKMKQFYVGLREHCWERYIHSIERKLRNADKRILFITYAGISTDQQAEIWKILQRNSDFSEVYLQGASPVIASTCGRGTFGIIYMDKMD